jgi:hypothetical protein
MATLMIGGRATFFPKFVNERFDPNNANGTGFWACTWSAFHVGIGVARLGAIPATHDELQAMVAVSGDEDKRNGSRTHHMIKTGLDRYGIHIRHDSVGVAEVKRRLAHGQVLVAGLWYGTKDGHTGLPEHYRRWSKGFFGAHRATLVGYDSATDRTRIFDPMANKGTNWTGEWIKWSDFEPAWWPDQQVWIAEGEGVMTTIRIESTFAPQRNFKIKTDRPIGGFRLDRPNTRLRVKAFNPATVAGKFDAVVLIQQAPGSSLKPSGRFIRVTSGHFKGLFVAKAGVSANFKVPAPPVSPQVSDMLRMEGARAEFQRVRGQAKVAFPASRRASRAPTVESLLAEIERMKQGARVDLGADPDGVNEREFETPMPAEGPARVITIPDTVSDDDEGDPDPPDPEDEPLIVPVEEGDSS